MAIAYEQLMNLDIPEVEQTYSARDTILYALGIGMGADPLDTQQLRFVYEGNLQALPTLAVVLGHPGPWPRDLETGIDYSKVVHGEQGVRLHKGLPSAGTVIGKTRVTAAIDKGPGRGALVMSERVIRDKSSGDLLATTTQALFARADGGFGGPAVATVYPQSVPERTPDLICDLPTLPQAALIYRLSGDYNPLHADPELARTAGFDKPILHGLATYGVAGHAILKSVCGYEPSRLKSLACRFTAPAFPGETLRTEIWRAADKVMFQTRVLGRNVIVAGNGSAEIQCAAQ
jgi:acyl dehydratase